MLQTLISVNPAFHASWYRSGRHENRDQSGPHGVREHDSTCKLAKDGDGWVFLKASHPDFEG